MLTRSLLLCAWLGLGGCHASSDGAAAKAKAEPAASTSASRAASASAPRDRHHFGAPLGASPAVALETLLQTPERFADQSVTVEANVRRACTRKGCWMELSDSDDPGAPGCRVTFQDYGFFVPTDSAGSRARVEARVQSRVVKPELVAHLESEGARFPQKAADGSAREVRLVASGVELWRQP